VSEVLALALGATVATGIFWLNGRAPYGWEVLLTPVSWISGGLLYHAIKWGWR